jgi:hypothetical protein
VRRTSESVREVRWKVFWEGEWRKESGESGDVGSQWTALLSAAYVYQLTVGWVGWMGIGIGRKHTNDPTHTFNNRISY